MAKSATLPASVVYRLHPDDDDLRAAHELLDAYRRMLVILAETTAGSRTRANVVELTRLSYDRIRRETGIPSRLVALGIRDYAKHLDAAPESVAEIPLDEKLFAIKGPSEITLTTLGGRRALTYSVIGHGPAWREISPARLIIAGDTLTLEAGVAVAATAGELKTMAETIRTRVGRLIAGYSNAALDRAEGREPLAIAQQALREIDKLVEEARLDVGGVDAERARIGLRLQQLEQERTDLDGKIATALERDRDDLARAGIARQVDIETQVGTLTTTLVDVEERLATAKAALSAALATRRDAEHRVGLLQKPASAKDSTVIYGQTPAPAALREGKLEGSLKVIERLTGVPGLKGNDAEGIEALEDLHRQSEIDRRLAEIRKGRPS